MNASASPRPGFWKNDPKVRQNSAKRLRPAPTGPSRSGRGNTSACQMLNPRNSTATASNVSDHARSRPKPASMYPASTTSNPLPRTMAVR